MTSVVADLLAQLAEGNTRRGAGCEVDKHPTPSTRGIRRVAGLSDTRKRQPVAVDASAMNGSWTTTYSDGSVETKTKPAVKPPLSELFKPNGKPNYRSWEEQVRYLGESGWNTWSMRQSKPKTWPTGVEWPLPYDAWLAQVDPERFAATKIDVVEPEELSPIERLAVEPAHHWRRWTGNDSKHTCTLCELPGGYSVAGHPYCRVHVGEADIASRKGEPLPGVDPEALEAINLELEVAA